MVMVVAIGVVGIANRRGLQAPLLLIVVGGAASYLPGLDRVELEPEIILFVVLPPLLYSAAISFAFRAFMRNIVAILGLGIGLVVVTALVVGFVAEALVPALTLPAAIVLGAVVSPPDAVTATAVGRRLGLPKRMMSILTGESLVNDAAALTVMSLGVAAVVGTDTLIADPVLYFMYASVVGIIIGVVLASVAKKIRRRLGDSSMETVLGLVLPFAAYLAAEELHASGVLAVVFAGFSMGWGYADLSVSTRQREREVWGVVDQLLETFVFAYMGLQLKFVIEDVRHEGLQLREMILWAVVITLVVIVIRPIYMLALRPVELGSERLWSRISHYKLPEPLNLKHNLVLSWTGMRGVVTLAAAAGVPLVTSTGAPFPGRPVIQFVAFVAALATVLVQGATLPFLIAKFDVSDAAGEQRDEQQRSLARRISKQAAKRAFEDIVESPPPGVDRDGLNRAIDTVRRTIMVRIDADAAEGVEEREERQRRRMHQIGLVRREVVRRQRDALIAARNAGQVDDDIVRAMVQRLDADETATEMRMLGGRDHGPHK